MVDREVLKSRNLDLFKRRFPPLYQRLANHTPMTGLVFGDDGEPDVLLDGQRFYKGRASEYAEQQLENFFKAPDRLLLPPPRPDRLDEHTGRFLGDILRRAAGDGIEFPAAHASEKSFFLLVFGIGLGKHLDRLVEETECQAVFLVEPNIEFFRHSLEVYDWANLIEPIHERGGVVKFFIGNVPRSLAQDIRWSLRAINPCSVDGLTYFLHYDNPVFARTLSLIKGDLDLAVASLGFFFDETLMVKNAHGNLCSGKSRVYYRPSERLLGVPVFVVASGPSLDKDMEFIRDNADKAVIVSCGSAIRPLAVNSITPDFQIEVENIHVLPIIAQVAGEHDISSVCLVTASTAERGVERYFDRIVYYFRSGLSPFPIFCDSNRYCLKNPSPTVLNAGLSFAQEMGFCDLYLFGADLGVRDTDDHHARDTYHYTAENPILDEQVCDIPSAANFGGKCLTSKGFLEARDYLNMAIGEFRRGRRYFNCSDGIQIEDAQPQPARPLSFSAIEGGKGGVVEKLIGEFPLYTSERFATAWDGQKVVREINRFIEQLVAWLDGTRDFRDKAYLTRLMKLAAPEVDPETGAIRPGQITDYVGLAMAMLFRGTVFMAVNGFEYYLNRVPDEDKARRFEDIGRRELIATIENIRHIAIAELGGLGKPAGTGKGKRA